MSLTPANICTQEEAMKMLGYTNAVSMRRAIEKGGIPVKMYKTGGTFVFNLKDIEIYLESRKVEVA